ncbi:MAG: hybrid sensor histidine kinase/response regulator, partial [Nitrospirae bacterium]|nr:hybrid sensor histidine kinase/response regulator [Nitrospirota bacterium]
MDNTRQKILLVDDEPLNINVLVDILKPDYHVVVAKSGKDALRRATSAPQPDLILLDIIMPEMDGYEVCKALKEDPLTNSIPVIFITAMSDAEDEEKGFQLGAVDYITKPFSASTVKARAKTHLTLYRQNQSLIELNAIKNRFLAIASHDLRNPVSAIMGFCELLLNEGGIECLSEDQRDTVEYISLASAELLNLLNSLLDISAIESGKFPVVFRTGSLLQLIERRIKNIRHYTEKKGIAIREDLTSMPIPRPEI